MEKLQKLYFIFRRLVKGAFTFVILFIDIITIPLLVLLTLALFVERDLINFFDAVLEFEILFVLCLLYLFVFRCFVKGTFTISRLIKVLAILGGVLFLYFVLSHSVSELVDHILKSLGLEKEKSGYIVIGSIVGFTALLWGLGLRNRNIEMLSYQNLEDRFIRSVELTGKKELGIRLGGLAGLKVLATENVEMYKRVWEYLGGFLRNPPDLDREYTGIAMGKRPDIDYIAQILRDRSEEQRKWEKEEKFRLSLYRVHLDGADLRRAHLQRADLNGADLREAQLDGADLREAHLDGADLRETRLDRADLTKAYLKGADLSGARLDRANLRETRLDGADLSGARLDRANLRETRLDGANLTKAHLDEAYLRETRLDGADLNGADLSFAHLDRANITRTDLRNTKNLTKKQLETCCYYVGNPPLLPEGWDADEIGITRKT